MVSARAWEPLPPVAGVRIFFSLADIRPEPLHPHAPVVAPQVEQVGHTLYFLDETELFLNIYSVDEEENETLEYQTAVSSSTTSVQLPDDLSGTYIIEVVVGGLYFRGEIEL